MYEELDCFLSYAREDKPLAERIFLRLRRNPNGTLITKTSDQVGLWSYIGLGSAPNPGSSLAGPLRPASASAEGSGETSPKPPAARRRRGPFATLPPSCLEPLRLDPATPRPRD